jgi:hypothetical protein
MFKGYKTYITAGVAVITAVAAYATGDADAMQTANLVFTALMAAFIRHGVEDTANTYK